MKKRISDLLDDCYPENIEISETSPLSTQRIKKITMDRIPREKPVVKRRPLRFFLIAALIAVLVTTVVAADDLVLSQGWFMRYFSNQEVYAEITFEQLQALRDVTVEVDQSITCDGYTITLERVISDGYCSYFQFLVIAPEGVALGNQCTFEYDIQTVQASLMPNEHTQESQIQSMDGMYETVEDDDPTDNRKNIVLRITDTIGYSSESCVFRITGIDSAESNTNRTFIAEGLWEFRFALPTEFAQVEMLSKPIIFVGKERMTGERFTKTITSFSMRTLTASCVTKHRMPWGAKPYIMDGIRIVLKNGTVVEAKWHSSTNSDSEERHEFYFDEPISFADVAYVEFPGGAKALMPQQ